MLAAAPHITHLYRRRTASLNGSHFKFTSLNRTFIVVYNVKLVKHNLYISMNLVNLSKIKKKIPPFFLSLLDKIYKTGMAQGVHAYVL